MKKELDEELEEDSDLEEEEAEEVEEEEEIEEDSEESELEEPLTSEEPKLNLNFSSLNFDQFLPPIETMSDGSPVLENIESRIDRPGFVQMGTISGASESSSDSGNERKDTYLPDQSGDNGPKYLQPGGTETNIERVDVQNIGRDIRGLNVPQPENFFIGSESDFQSRNVEQIGMQPERIDLQNVGRKNPLERDEIKYEEHKKYEFDPSK